MFLKGFVFFFGALQSTCKDSLGAFFQKNKTMISKVVDRPMVFPLFLPIGVTDEKTQHVFPKTVVLQCSWSVRNDVVAGGFLLGSGYCRGNSWRLPEYILLFEECVQGPAMIFGGAGPWRALWVSALLLGVVPGGEKMVEGKKKARRRTKKRYCFFS